MKPLDTTSPTGNLGKISTQDSQPLADTFRNIQVEVQDAVYKTVRECLELAQAYSTTDKILEYQFRLKWPEAFK